MPGAKTAPEAVARPACFVPAAPYNHFIDALAKLVRSGLN
jgi:hypothetical protein